MDMNLGLWWEIFLYGGKDKPGPPNMNAPTLIKYIHEKLTSSYNRGSFGKCDFNTKLLYNV